jgi:hypothetical protein
MVPDSWTHRSGTDRAQRNAQRVREAHGLVFIFRLAQDASRFAAASLHSLPASRVTERQATSDELSTADYADLRRFNRLLTTDD